MQRLTTHMLVLIFFCITMETAREVCFKQAAHNVSIASALVKPVTWLGILFWLVEIISWTVVLQFLPLSIAFPIMSLCYVTTVITGAWVFKEPINFRHKLGVLLVTIGVSCVGATGI